jgi:hypothetical protein
VVGVRHERCSSGLASARAWSVGKDMPGNEEAVRSQLRLSKKKLSPNCFIQAATGDRSVGCFTTRSSNDSIVAFLPGGVELLKITPRAALLQGRSEAPFTQPKRAEKMSAVLTNVAMTWPAAGVFPPPSASSRPDCAAAVVVGQARAILYGSLVADGRCLELELLYGRRKTRSSFMPAPLSV